MRILQNKYQRQKQVISRIKNENKKLRQINKEQEIRIKDLENTVEELRLQIEELRGIIFGKKKKKDNDRDDKDDSIGNGSQDQEKKKRSFLSYRRPIPKEDETTKYEECDIENCPDCGSHLTRLKVVVRYIEDILPMSEWFKVLKQVKKKFITTGYCPHCRRRVSAEPLGKQVVSIGNNVRQFICYSNIILKLSYSQITDFLGGTINFNISEGEIANSLEYESYRLKPEFERIFAGIRGQPGVHMDETSWKILMDSITKGNYAWVMTGTENRDAVFLLGRNRGKGNAEELLGRNNNQVGISDDYGAYQNIFKSGKHALCWAHPHRKLRDLKNSGSLEENRKKHCENNYKVFANIYRKVQKICAEKFVRKKRKKYKEQLMKKFDEFTIPNSNDPLKLRKIKERLVKQKECYFTCITEPNIPPDNNKAERALRHLVLKRKNCYGSKTEKGARVSSILYSVLLSHWWKDKQNFFKNFEKLAI